MTSPARYDGIAVTLHWLMAVLLIALWGLGLVLEELPKGDFRAQMFGLHKAFGALVLVLVAARLAWRLTHAAPSLPDSMTGLEVTLARLGHLALYGLMIILPLSGIVMSQAGGREVSMFGLVLPTLVQPDHDLKEAFEEVHEVLAWILALVVGGHLLAALRHRFVLKDDVMARMLPGGN